MCVCVCVCVCVRTRVRVCVFVFLRLRVLQWIMNKIKIVKKKITMSRVVLYVSWFYVLIFFMCVKNSVEANIIETANGKTKNRFDNIFKEAFVTQVDKKYNVLIKWKNNYKSRRKFDKLFSYFVKVSIKKCLIFLFLFNLTESIYFVLFCISF